MATSQVVLRQVIKQGRTRTIESADGVVLDPRDEDDCVDVLRRMAKRNGLKPSECELYVKSGTRTATYRV